MSGTKFKAAALWKYRSFGYFRRVRCYYNSNATRLTSRLRRAAMNIFNKLLIRHVSDIKQRTKWYIRTRWFFLLAIIIPGLLSNYVGEGFSSQVQRDLSLGLLALSTNLLATWLGSQHHSKKYFRIFGVALLVLDIVTITMLIFIKGGVESRSPILYTIPLLMASAIFGQYGVYYTAVLSIVLYNSLILADWLNIIRTIGAVNPMLRYNGTYVLNTVTFFTSVLLIIALLADFITKLMKEQQRELNKEKDRTETEKIKDEAILKSVGEGMIVTDEKGIITEVNPTAEELLSTSAENLIGKWYPKLVVLVDKQGNAVDSAARPEMEAIISGTPTVASQYFLSSGTRTLPVAVTASPYMVDAHPVGVVIMLRDVTKERELDQAKDDFIALASHQLRTPATAIKQFVGMLLEGYAGKLTAEQKDLLGQAYASNERQIRITQDMLSVAQLESGTLKLQPEELDTQELIRSAVVEQQFVIDSRQQKLTVKAKPGLLIQGDRNLLRMVIDNFISNASKYTPEKGAISITTVRNKNTVEITVTDTGVGISAADQKLLFKRFSRAENKLSTKVGGSGLGLYIAKKIIALHSGFIRISSVVDKGTTFEIVLPVPAEKDKP